MATLPPNWDQEEEENSGQAAGPAQSTQNTSTQSGLIGGGSGGSGSGGNQPSPQSGGNGGGRGTGYVNVQSYVDKNQGSGFGQKTADRVQGSVDEAKSGLNNATQTFYDQANQQTFSKPTDVMRKLDTRQFSDITGDKRLMDQYNSAVNAKYTGPQGLGDTSGIRTQFNKAQDNLTNTETQAGRNTLVQDFYKRPTYTRGETRLDQAILSADPNARSAFQGVREANQGIGEMLPKAEADARQRAMDQQAKAKALRNMMTGYTKDKADAYKAQRQTLAEMRNEDRRRAYESALRVEQLKRKGPFLQESDEWKAIQDEVADKFLYKGDVGFQNTLSKDEIAQMNAISKLLGLDDQYKYNYTVNDDPGFWAEQYSGRTIGNN